MTGCVKRQLLRKGGANAIQRDGKTGTGKMGFDFGEDAGTEVDHYGVFAESVRHDDEDAVDFGLLFVEEADEFVILLDSFKRLDEYSLSGGG